MDERKHLTAAEVEKRLAATKGSRNAARDRCLLLLMPYKAFAAIR